MEEGEEENAEMEPYPEYGEEIDEPSGSRNSEELEDYMEDLEEM
jgi:hypothetical protein